MADNQEVIRDATADVVITGQEPETHQHKLEKTKRELQPWRQALIPVGKVLSWQKPYYPALLLAFNSVVFIVIWYLNLSILSTLALLAMAVTLVDYLVPIVTALFFDPTAWSPADDKEYEAICEHITNFRTVCNRICGAFLAIKRTVPRLFTLVLSVCFFVLAMIFDQLNNFLLMYLITSFVLLIPGLFSNRHFHKLHGMTQGIRSKFSKKAA